MGAKKLTKSDVEKWLVADGRGIKIVGDYLNNATKTTFECADGHQWTTAPNNIKSGSGCPVCAGNIKLTKSDIESWLVADGRGIKIIGEYANTHAKTIFECADGHQWSAKPGNIKNGAGCPVCAGNIKLTKSDIESWLVADGRGIKLIGDYINVDSKTTFECAHGHQWNSRPSGIKNGHGCHICAAKTRTLTKSDIESWLVADGRGIKLIGDYIHSATKTTFECARGHQWNSRLHGIKNGHGCHTCALEVRTLTKSDLESWLIEDGRGIKLIGDYINVDSKTTFECAYGHQWKTTPSSIKSGTGCPVCSTGGGFKPNLPAWEYIFTRGTYLKYGITNNLNRRAREHKQYGEIEIVHLRQHDIGQHALDWENRIKQKFGGKYVTDVLCPDGWTETLPISHLKLLKAEKLVDTKRKSRYNTIFTGKTND